jgi:hypothetical protein
MKKNILKLIIILILFLAYQYSSKSDCPNQNDWTGQKWTFYCPSSMEEGEWGRAQYQYKDNGNGTYDIKIDWSTYIRYTTCYGITDEEAKPLIYYSIIDDFMEANCETPGTILHFNFYVETPCTITKKCWIKVNEGTHVLCTDTGWPGPDPSFYQDASFAWWYAVTKDIPCGTQCCETKYTAECLTPSTGNHYKTWQVTSIIKSQYSPCTGSSSTDCLFHQIENCQSSCGN